MNAQLSTADRLAAYVTAVEEKTGKQVVRARVIGREIVLEFQGCSDSTNPINPADLITP